MDKYKDKIPVKIFDILKKKGFEELRPSQEKSINSGLFEGNNLLVCTPTASGKTLVGEMAMIQKVLNGQKAVYVVPLRALASEKYKHFKKEYPDLKIGVGSGDIDGEDRFLNFCDIIICTSEKLDSLIRHKASFLSNLGCLVVDEIHLLNDPNRGPTLEVVITLLKEFNPQIIGLSATIGNPVELADWLEARLVIDTWRPVELKKGVFLDRELEFFSKRN